MDRYGAGNHAKVDTRRRPAVRAALVERAVAPATKPPEFPHCTFFIHRGDLRCLLFLDCLNVGKPGVSPRSALKLHAGALGSGLLLHGPFRSAGRRNVRSRTLFIESRAM